MRTLNFNNENEKIGALIVMSDQLTGFYSYTETATSITIEDKDSEVDAMTASNDWDDIYQFGKTEKIIEIASTSRENIKNAPNRNAAFGQLIASINQLKNGN